MSRRLGIGAASRAGRADDDRVRAASRSSRSRERASDPAANGALDHQANVNGNGNGNGDDLDDDDDASDAAHDFDSAATRGATPPSDPTHRTTRLYVKTCEALRVAPDASVLACLETEWHVLALSPHAAVEGALLPLVSVLALPEAAHVKTLRAVPSPALRQHRFDVGSGDVDARCVAQVLRRNRSIEEVDVSCVGLGPQGVHELAGAVAESPSLRRLYMAHNWNGREAYGELEAALRASKALDVLDVSYNMLGHSQLRRLQRARPHMRLIKDGNHVVEEIVNATTHFLGLLVALGAVTALLWHASVSKAVFFPSLLYGFTLVAMFACSTACHSSFLFKRASRITNVLDHAAIYLLIAGSCSPFLHIGLAHVPLAWVVAAAQWFIALVGITFGLYANHANFARKMAIEMVIYFTEGLIVLVLRQEIGALVGPDVLFSIYLSGALYTVGSVFFVAEHSVHPLAHGVWHLFVVAAAFTHWHAVFTYVVSVEAAFRVPAACIQGSGGAQIFGAAAQLPGV